MVFLIALIIIAIFFILFLMQTKSIKQITTTDLKEKMQAQFKQFIGVRTPREYQINRLRAFRKILLHALSTQAE